MTASTGADDAAEHAGYSKQYLHTDIVIVGGGPAGLAAARAAAGQGAEVLLIDENSSLGGHTRFGPSGAHVNPAVPDHVTVLTDTTVMGWYTDNWLFAVRGQRLFKIRARAMIVAAGAYEAPLVFENNDLPGVMLGSAVQRLLHLYGVAPGRRPSWLPPTTMAGRSRPTCWPPASPWPPSSTSASAPPVPART